MASLKSKQIADFNPAVSWNSATESEIPNSKDIQNAFIPEASLRIDEFTGVSINASAGNWDITLSSNVQANSIEFVTVYVNGMKLKVVQVSSVLNNVVTMFALPYDIVSDDVIEVHYVETHTV
jgi:hypothetical protein